MKTVNHYVRPLLTATLIGLSSLAQAEIGPAEKPDLKLGFIKLTDMAPLAVAWEQGYFMDEGLFVELEAQANWKVLLDRVITGELDGAHMLAGQPLGASIGYGTQADIITAFSMDLNGNGITVSNDVWEAMKPNLEMEVWPTRFQPAPLSPWWSRPVPMASASAWAWCFRCPPTITNCVTGWPPVA